MALGVSRRGSTRLERTAGLGESLGSNPLAADAGLVPTTSLIDRPHTPTPTAERDYARIQPLIQVHPPWMHRYTIAIVSADLAAAGLASLFAYATSTTPPYIASLALPPLWVGALALGRTYEHRFVGNGTDEYKRLFHAGVAFLAVCSTLAYAASSPSLGLRDFGDWRRMIVVGIPLAIALSLLAHWGVRQGLHHLRRQGRCCHRVVVIGFERSVAELIRTLRREPYAGLDVVGVCIDNPSKGSIEGVPVLGKISGIVAAVDQVGADTVAVTAWSDVSQTDLRRLSWNIEGTGVTLLVAPRLADVAGPRIHVRPVAGLPLLNVEEPEFTGVRRIVKGGMDRLLALVAVVLLLPLMLAVAVAVRVGSPGPVLFRQVRIGRHGEPFTIHKFRSMHIDAEERLADIRPSNESDGPLFKIKEDPRVTAVGRFIRSLSIDEWPQFFDVLRGRMSLVGPRPPLPAEVENYPLDVRRRLVVKPGITGLWQVSGRSNLSWEDSIRLDLQYVENWSLTLDVTIMMKTVLAVLRRDGAY